ncbi:CE022 protein, partial [Acromyrmex insinuator]
MQLNASSIDNTSEPFDGDEYLLIGSMGRPLRIVSRYRCVPATAPNTSRSTCEYAPNYRVPNGTCHLTYPYEAVDRIFQEVTSVYRDSEVDWMLVYNAGCTIDDTVLPEHVTEPNDLDRLINGTFRLFLTALPTPPTIVTIARSSEDDYTPLENVDQIQVDVLDQLRERLGSEIDIKLIYQDEEQQ